METGLHENGPPQLVMVAHTSNPRPQETEAETCWDFKEKTNLAPKCKPHGKPKPDAAHMFPDLLNEEIRCGVSHTVE